MEHEFSMLNIPIWGEEWPSTDASGSIWLLDVLEIPSLSLSRSSDAVTSERTDLWMAIAAASSGVSGLCVLSPWSRISLSAMADINIFHILPQLGTPYITLLFTRITQLMCGFMHAWVHMR